MGKTLLPVMMALSAMLLLAPVVAGGWARSTFDSAFPGAGLSAPAPQDFRGEPRGLLTLSVGFGLVVLLGRRERRMQLSETCSVIDIRDRFRPNSPSKADELPADGEPDHAEQEALAA